MFAVDWNPHTACLAIASGVMSTIRGEETALRIVCDPEEVNGRITCTYGFTSKDFVRLPTPHTPFPATRAVIDLSAFLAQEMNIPHEHWERFMSVFVDKGPHNTIRK